MDLPRKRKRKIKNVRAAASDVAGPPIRYPDFLCIGAQKAGTTWLYARLKQNKQLWLPPVKELHYFDHLHLAPRPFDSPLNKKLHKKSLLQIRKIAKQRNKHRALMERIYCTSLIARRRLSDDWYGHVFACAPKTAICGEITPEYAILPDEGLAHMKRLMPNPKLIFIMRDPIARGWSDMRMRLKNKNTDDVDSVRTMIDALTFRAKADYMGTIEQYRSTFSPESLLLLYLDELSENPQQLMQRIHGFLGLDDTQYNGLEKVQHRGKGSDSIPSHIYQQMRETLRPVYERLRALDDPTVEGWYRSHYG